MSISPTRIQGIDGRSYPSSWLNQNEREYLIGRVHYLAHDEQLSVRVIARRLADEHEVFRRSVGAVHHYLTAYLCPRCSGVDSETPEQRASATNLESVC